MKNKKQVAPSLEDLSHAQVESSYLFGFTNVSGKILALTSVSTLAASVVGITQVLGYLGPVLGVTLNIVPAIAAAGVSVVTGLLGYWLGNFDDKKIKAHNDASGYFNHTARGKVYDRVEHALIKALSKLEYDPKEKHLPYDALGYAALLTDEKIAELPAHVQLDIYRTQLDLELYKSKRLVSANTWEGTTLEKRIMDDPSFTMERKAEEYKITRDRVRAMIVEGILIATPLSEERKEPPKDLPASQVKSSGDSSGIGADIAHAAGDIAVDVADILRVTGRRAADTAGNFRFGGGGGFGGGGAGGSWGDALPRGGSIPGRVSLSGSSSPGGAFFGASMSDSGRMGLGGMSGSGRLGLAGMSEGGRMSFGGGGGGSGKDSFFKDLDLGDSKDAGAAILVIVAIAAAVAAAAVAGFSVKKNFFTSAEKPALEGVHLPMIAKSLATAEKDIRHIYAPS